MKILKVILAVLEIGIGVWFLANIASDIQAGFGLVLLAIGLNSLVNSFLVSVR